MRRTLSFVLCGLLVGSMMPPAVRAQTAPATAIQHVVVIFERTFLSTTILEPIPVH